LRQFALVNEATGERTVIQQELTIGRRDGDLVIDDSEVSQTHAQLYLDAGELVITDLESRNGCFVDDRRIAGSHFLLDGQTIRLGQTRWKVEITGGIASGSTQVAAMPNRDGSTTSEDS
jgi:pSer/pThr/pTyr-binding forkhead associated (FHA) protein